MINIAVFASGNGSNFQAIYESVAKGDLNCSISLLVCDKPGAKVLERAKEANVNTLAISPRDFESKEEYEQHILDELREKGVQFIVLAGYMRLIGSVLLQAYPNKIVNIHPSLLPDFPGKDAIGQAIEAGVSKTGVTIHFVDEGMDTGKIIAQKAIEIKEGDGKEDIEARIHQIEHSFYPDTLQTLFRQLAAVK